MFQKLSSNAQLELDSSSFISSKNKQHLTWRFGEDERTGGEVDDVAAGHQAISDTQLPVI